MFKNILFLVLLVISMNSFAYIGPGAGAGIFATIIGIVAAIILLLVSVIYYPLKKLLKKHGKPQKKKKSS